MTLRQLNELFDLRDRLKKAQDMKRALESAACPGAQVLTGMPHVTGVKDRVGDLGVEIGDLATKIEKLKAEIKEKEKDICSFLDTVDDDEARICFRLRFFRALTWGEVAGILGREYTEDKVKKLCYKFLEEETYVAKWTS